MAKDENKGSYAMIAIVAIVAIVGIVMLMNARTSETKTADYSAVASENVAGDARRRMAIEDICAVMAADPAHFQTDHRGLDSWYTLNC